MWCFGGFLECQLHCRSCSVGPASSHKPSQYCKQHPVSEEIQGVSWGYVSEVRERDWEAKWERDPKKVVQEWLQLPLEEPPWWILCQCCHLPQLYICGCAAWLLSFLRQLQAAELLLPVKSLQPRAQKAFSPWWGQYLCPGFLATTVISPGSQVVLLSGCRKWKDKWPSQTTWHGSKAWQQGRESLNSQAGSKA